MNEEQLKRLEELRTKPKLTEKEWEEYEGLVKMQYETGDNDPKPDEPQNTEGNEELPN